MIEIDWQTKAESLWGLLDDIDTASDMFKPHDEKSYKQFFDYAMKRCQERGKYMNSLDGQTLISVEQEIYDREFKQRVGYLSEWENHNERQVKDIINNKTQYMDEKAKSDYIFKWCHLVQQEIVMWVQINKPVSQKEIDEMCERRGFDKAMKNYLISAMQIVYLYEGMKLPSLKQEIPEEPTHE